MDVCDPDLLLPLKQTRVNERHSDLGEPQPSSSDSQPDSFQPVSETTTSESSMSLPSSPSGSSYTTSTVQVALIVLRLRHHLKAALSHRQMLQAQRQQHQPVLSDQRHQNC